MTWLNRSAMSRVIFQVLLLVLADGDDVGVIKQDVGRLEHGVGEEAVLGGEALPGPCPCS